MSKNLLFIIYSCHARLELAERLYNVIHDKLDYCKVYICVGNPDSDTGFLNDKYIILKVGDQHDDLVNKTLSLLKFVEQSLADYKGIFKCDDNIIPNIKHINSHSKDFLENNIEYAGNINHIYKSPNIVYCNSPLYYISMNSITKFNNTVKDYFIFQEDLMVGYYLNRCNIFPKNYNLYYNELENFKLGSYQNINNKTKNLYIMFVGRLGNNLFQIASGYGLAKKYKMNLFFTWDNHESYNISQNYVYRDNIFKNKNLLFIDNTLINYNNVNIYTEQDDINNPRLFNNIITDIDSQGIATKDTLIVNGYLQHDNYFKDYKQDIIELFKNNEMNKILLNKYHDIKESCFIHIRRGDYVNQPLWWIDNDKYFKTAIDYILNVYKDMHFYILSDDIEYCKTYHILNNINKTFIQDMEPLSTLYFMGLTKCGIIHNSTLSWWGGYMNQNPDKIMIIPRKWFNNNKPNDIYFEGSVVLDS
jgi:hypothetical protein